MANTKRSIEYTGLFPTADGGNLSHTFDVIGEPVVVSAFNLRPGQKLMVEMVVEIDCELYYGPYSPCCCQVGLTHKTNNLVLATTGSYRLFVHDPNADGYEDLKVVMTTAHTHDDPSHCACGCEEADNG